MMSYFFFFIFSICLAAPPSNDNKNVIGQQLQKSKENILMVETQERSVLSKLFEINAKMKNMSKKRDKLTSRVLLSKSNAKDLAVDINTLEDSIASEKTTLSQRLRHLYKMGDAGVLPLLFSSTSAHDLEKHLKYLKSISERDYEIIKDYESNLQTLISKREKLKREVATLLSATKNLKWQEKELENEQKQKSEVLTVLKTNQQKEVGALLKIKKLASEGYQDLLEDSFYTKKGDLRFPISGEVIQKYGLIKSDLTGQNFRFKGNFFSAGKGEKIRSIHKGTVNFVGEVPGYGMTIIVAHGDHYYSLYSNVESSTVKEGRQVKSGESLGTVGGHFQNLGYGLYFEIRHFSEAIDPSDWLTNRAT